jgi:ribonuclease HII
LSHAAEAASPQVHSLAPIRYAGIDEAGLGPRLGPLCVGAVVLRAAEPLAAFESAAPDSSPAPAPVAATSAPKGTAKTAAKPPNLWQLLRTAVARRGKRADDHRLFVDDSKRILRGGDPADRARLEEGVLAALAAGSLHAADDHALGRALGLPERWTDAAGTTVMPTAALARALPRHCCAQRLRLRAGALAGALDAARLHLSLHCLLLHAHEFNDACERLGNKAFASFSLVACHLSRVWRALTPGEPALVAIDRQGGRTRYAAELAAALEDARVDVLDERPLASRYDVLAPDGRRMIVEFRVEAESTHFPVALASMTAKYIRELSMDVHNDAWCARIPELKPTAGYGSDARRWINDVRPHVSDDELAAIVRRR